MKDENGKDQEIMIQPRRIRRSLLSPIKKMQTVEGGVYAEKLFDEMDKLEKEIDEKEERLYVCNSILERMLQTTVNIEDGEY